jgi:hypothetical protein
MRLCLLLLLLLLLLLSDPLLHLSLLVPAVCAYPAALQVCHLLPLLLLLSHPAAVAVPGILRVLGLPQHLTITTPCTTSSRPFCCCF